MTTPRDVADRWKVIHGDCLEVMRGMAANSVSAVVTDPPYIIGGISTGQEGSKTGTWADMENAAHWFSVWYGESKRLIGNRGFLVTCGSWRTLPTILRGLALAKFPATSCMVWDKEWIGPGGPNGLRPRYEVVVFAATDKARIRDRGAPDVFSCKWMAGNMKTTAHPAEKPVALLARLVELVTVEGELVLDPFAGSGTTGVACVKAGRSFMGIEREAEWVSVARQRIEAAAAQTNLFGGEAA